MEQVKSVSTGVPKAAVVKNMKPPAPSAPKKAAAPPSTGNIISKQQAQSITPKPRPAKQAAQVSGVQAPPGPVVPKQRPVKQAAVGVPPSPTIPRAAPKQAATAATPKPLVETPATRTKFRRIVFCEPYTQKLDKLKNSDFNNLSITSAPVKVTEEFYTVLCGVPAKIHKKEGNAYIFGDRFPPNEYKLIGDHSNDGAQTGFIDFDLIQDVPNYQDIWQAAYPDLKWEPRNGLKKIQKDAPFVLWIGETVGGDVGASLYAHFKQGTRHIDGLIVDNNCVFSREMP